jgi:hypothetical protein
MVLVEALKQRGLEFGHHVVYNPRRPERLRADLDVARADLDVARADLGHATVGFIVNEAWKNWVLSGHHWYAVVPRDRCPDGTLQAGSVWQNRDSKLARPVLVEAPGTEAGSTDALFAYLEGRARNAAAQVFLVRRLLKAPIEQALSKP